MNQRQPQAKRRALLTGTAAALVAPGFAWAQSKAPAARGPAVVQIVDTSIAQQDVSKDFLIGSRAAWQDFNARGGLKGRSVQHLSVETDGTAQDLARALQSARANADCVALTGSAGDPATRELVKLNADAGSGLCLAAPWLHEAPERADERLFAIFASREQQVRHAMRTLSVMGVTELGVVHPSARERTLYQEEMQRMAHGMKLRLSGYVGGDDLQDFGQRLPANAPAVLLFTGGTPELVPFTQGLAKQSRLRYVVALADVNLQTVLQMGVARNVPLIATQVVPVTTSSLPIVRAYRDTLSRLFDEPPTPQSLAGFISARYVQHVMADGDGNWTRQGLLSAFTKRREIDLGGLRIAFDAQGRPTGYVTQSMLSADGRILG